MTTSNINRPPRIYINLPMVKDLVGTYSADELTDKAFKVKDWMERNPKNEWVQNQGKIMCITLGRTTPQFIQK